MTGVQTCAIPICEKGDKGDPGPKGDRGADGVSATITIGSVTAGATADMWMTGTPQARELHSVLPRGQKGDRGEQGLREPAGASVTRTAPGVFTIEEVVALPRFTHSTPTAPRRPARRQRLTMP